MLCLEVILSLFTTDHKHVEETGSVALHKVVLRIVHRNTIDYEIVSVDVGLRGSDTAFPHTISTFSHSHTTTAPIALQRYLLRLGSIDAEGDGITLDFRRHHLLAASTIEVVELLSLDVATQHRRACNDC